MRSENFVIVVIKDIRDPGCFLDYKRISLTKLKVLISFFGSPKRDPS